MIQSTFITLRENKFYTISSMAMESKANIMVVHGYGEHIGRYHELISFFNTLGLNVYGYDRRGEGRSEGHRAYVHTIANQVSDLTAMRSQLIKNNLPTFIYGHSLGGLITTQYLIDNPQTSYVGAILSGALIKVDDGISPLLQKVSGFVAAILPKLKTVKVDTNLLSRNPKIKPAYEADPYVYQGGTPARTGDQILKSTTYVQSNFDKISLPILITHGGADKLSDPKGSHMLFSNIVSQDKELKIYENLYHEIMHEPEKDQVFKTMSDWIKRQTASF